jgi:hypothetical protein
LIAQELGGGLDDLGIVLGLLLRQGGREGFSADPALAGLDLGRFLLGPQQASQ